MITTIYFLQSSYLRICTLVKTSIEKPTYMYTYFKCSIEFVMLGSNTIRP